MQKSRSAEVKELFAGGFGVHHAGMLRADRGLSERLFSEGLLNVLVCTAAGQKWRRLALRAARHSPHTASLEARE